MVSCIFWGTTWLQVWKDWGRPQENFFNRASHQTKLRFDTFPILARGATIEPM